MGDIAKRSVGIVETQQVRLDLPTEGFVLDSGKSLPELEVAYETYGVLSAATDNAVFICHALTGDAHAAGYHGSLDSKTVGWWEEMVGPGKGIDTDHYFVICANILGGCKGTTGPGSVDPRTGKPYGSEFPNITVGDIVNAHQRLLAHLGVERLAAVVGGSLGGMQALEWAIRAPDMIDRCICIAAGASLSAQALAFDIVGRRAITSDPAWQEGNYYGTGRSPDAGLASARQIGHITYLSQEMMTRKFGRERQDRDSDEAAAGGAATLPFRSDFQVESYLEHQGGKFVKRFDANSYLHITRAIDEYDLDERFGSLQDAFASLKASSLIVALSADWLFTPEQSVEMANALLRGGKHVSYCELQAPHGHDAFLVDIQHLSEVIRAFLPWVAAGPDHDQPESGRAGVEGPFKNSPVEREKDAVVQMVQPGASVLDLGCGGGELLSLLSANRSIVGLGVDIDIQNFIEVLDRGHDVFQADIDAGLAMIPDHSYDYAILSETLQVVRRPRFVLKEMLRVAREGIVSFPNFANWEYRLHLGLHGRMPKSRALPFEWYDTPNIHLFTLKDFRELCRKDGIDVLDCTCLGANAISRMLLRLGFYNIGANRVLLRIAPSQTGA